MSYYSDVKCVMYKKNWEEIRNRIKENTEIDEFARDRFINRVSIEERDDIVICSWESMNHWDECSDEAVQMFLSYIRTQEYEYNMPYKYICVGEGCGTETDIDVQYNYSDDFEMIEKFNIIDYRVSIDIF